MQMIVFFAVTVTAVFSAQPASRTTGYSQNEIQQAGRPLRQDETPDWAKEFVRQNPLEQQSSDELSLVDLEKALERPEQRQSLMRHFFRAKLSAEDADRFLIKAMDQPDELGIEATVELQRRGKLSGIVRDRLEDLKTDRNQNVVRASGQAVELLRLPEIEPEKLQGLLAELVEHLGSRDPARRDDAHARLAQMGLNSVPTLLQLLNHENAELRKSASLLLGEIVAAENSARRTYAATEPNLRKISLPPPKSGPELKTGPTKVRIVSDESPSQVQVFYGTNRQIISETSDPFWRVWSLPAVFILLLFLFFSSVGKKHDKPERRSPGCVRFSMKLFVLILLLATVWYWNSAVQQAWSMHRGIRFGTQREQPDVIHYGYCMVTLPPTHRSGKLERPWLGPEHENRHVVLRETSALEEDEFYQAIKSRLGQLKSTSRDCFIFVHGFNVLFENAARRTAQIAYDLNASGEFEGIPVFYSWPSAGSPIMYSWDRAEIRNSKRYIKKFLQDVARNIDADKIHIVAHSMGADLVSQAITEIDSDEKLFHQIVLAAPDIDGDVFRQEIAPSLTRKSVRTTMYCSRNDFALQISYQFNNARRVGDTSDGVFVVKDVDTIDASEIPTDLLGHSYYGDCVPMAADIAKLMKSNASPSSEQRGLKPRPWKELFYWVFGD